MPFELVRSTENGSSIRVIVKLTDANRLASNAHIITRLNDGKIDPKDCAFQREIGLKDKNNTYVLIMIPKEIYGHIFEGKPIVLR